MTSTNMEYPTAPIEAVMPAALQHTVLWIASIVLGLFVLLALRQSFKQKTALPLLFLVAGFCTILLEPMVTHMGHAVHPVIGQITLFRVAERSIPWHIAIIYSFYFGGVYMFLYPRLSSGAVTAAFVWKCYWGICAFAYLIEILPVQQGLWIYYDQQALWLWKGGMPLFWTFVNASCIFFPMAIMKLLQSSLIGIKQLLVIPISVMGANMAHFGAGVPYYSAANSSASPLLIELSGLVSVGLALLVVHICAQIFALPATERAGTSR